ncbi:hypothetical protein [Brevibacterium zhoupengii]|uniref:hypothetical protein n=1 Tax=Brevibacterium zhoupengii TaxID=2898795 RepID=UPI001F099DF2|nr:hypothetical protein [Brevibacterium zhoupengii]
MNSLSGERYRLVDDGTKPRPVIEIDSPGASEIEKNRSRKIAPTARPENDDSPVPKGIENSVRR